MATPASIPAPAAVAAATAQPSSPRVSYSKLRRWAECRHAYALHYLERHPTESGPAARLGSTVHRALEMLEREAIANGTPGAVPADTARAAFVEAAIELGLTDIEAFEDGLRMVEDWRMDRGYRDPADLLAVEHRFAMRVGRFTVEGAIDLVERTGPTSIRVTDYKSQRALFTPDELRTNVQLSLYEAAVRRAWPWVRDVQLTMWLLRHRVRQDTSRTADQLAAALTYVETLGEQLARATEFPASLGGHCGWCDHRAHCADYRAALAGERTPSRADLGDLDAVVAERQQLVGLGRLYDKRVKELDAAIKPHLRDTEVVHAGRHRLRLFKVAARHHPLVPTTRVLARALHVSDEDVLARIATVDKRALDRLLTTAAAELGGAHATLLRLEVDAVARTRTTQRVWIDAPAAAFAPPPQETP
jgi:RecB family exonuclease